MKADHTIFLFLGLTACDRSGDALVFSPLDGTPSVIEAGQLEVIGADTWAAMGPQAAINKFGLIETLGPPDQGIRGGASFTFKGTGGDVCVLTDPETVFWGHAVSPTASPGYRFPDNNTDDGDVDLFVGLTAFYTGSPGIELGDFEGVYTDSQGQQITIEYNECSMIGSAGLEVHAGRGAPEHCTIDTDQREGVDFTVTLETFVVPVNDRKVDFVAAVVEGTCGSLSFDECSYLGESRKPAEMSDEEYEVVVTGLEDAYCNNELEVYCCTYRGDFPDVCGEEPEEGFCEGVLEAVKKKK